MTDLIARLTFVTRLAPDVIADLDPAMFEALSDGFELRWRDGDR